MDRMTSKLTQWIEQENRDPRSARWQAALEEIMSLFIPRLEKGKLTPVNPLQEQDIPIFKSALASVDLSPGLWAAFLPPSAAALILPPADAMEELVRIDSDKPSYKIIIQRPGKESRILCTEISEYAHRPGIDIFQEGALLGSFNYETHEICLEEMTKAVRAHAWEKDKWSREDIIAYTVNWFEKVLSLEQADVSVEEKRSFFHSPTLIQTNRVDALFRLLTAFLNLRFQADPENFTASLPDKIGNGEDRMSACNALAESYLLDLLNTVRSLALLDFKKFTGQEEKKFKTEFTRSVRKLASDLDKMDS
ncbi:hypothetical protein DSCOOX_38770 [Desulfosarcina ovata subsp. ovata]|uniref:Uncharacterized protein n=2 Tax=Desulfosarcina ovata TaxID=83564 RepID=A0A5K8ADP1_9BACT|nr:hypothetical protein DSCOOX_38770 [Desulfosarcina ovata subsp. ovata]